MPILRSFVRHYRRSFNLEARFGLDQATHLHDRHRGKVPAHELAVGLADRFQGTEVFLLVEHVPGEAHDVLGLAAGLRQDGEDVLERLAELPGEIARFPPALAGPADLAGDEDDLAAGDDAVREALGARPARRLKDFHAALNLKRCSFPVSVRGSVSTNSIARGYL